MPQPTKGPWKATGRNVSTDGAGLIARCDTRPDGEHVANAAVMAASLDMLSVLEEFVEDVRRAYIGEQEDEMLKHSALAHNWPDLCVTYRKAQKAIAAAKGAQ